MCGSALNSKHLDICPQGSDLGTPQWGRMGGGATGLKIQSKSLQGRDRGGSSMSACLITCEV